MNQIEIEWVELGIRITAELVYTKNSNLAELLWDKLPYNSIQNHALVSGDHLYHMCPFRELVYTTAMNREDRTKSADGTLFLSHLQHLAIKYGPLSEYLPAAAVGHVIPEHMPLLREAGRGTWEAAYRNKRVIEVRVTRKGQPVSRFSVPKAVPVSDASVQALINEIQAELESCWIKPPEEILDVHAGRIPSGAGSCGQYFATLVFVNGETRPLGYSALGGLIKSCMRTNVSLELLVEMTPHFIKVPAEFLGYCGLARLWDFTQRTLAALGSLGTKEEYMSLISTLALYVNRLNGWNLHYFPWRHGEEYRYQPVARDLHQRECPT
jgi:hypothetical protein